MNILQMILEAQGGDVMKQIAGNFGISEQQAQGAAGKLVPALAQGMKKNASTPDGLEALLRAAQKGRHTSYLDNPAELQREDSIADGNAILGHIFGKKDVSRNLASRASEQTGVDSGILKKMLPMLAGLAMGALGKQESAGSAGGFKSGLSPQGGGSQLGMLTSFLDADKDGSIVDDLLGMAKKFL